MSMLFLNDGSAKTTIKLLFLFCATFLAILIYYICVSYKLWHTDFAKKRVPRSSVLNPSHCQPPSFTTFTQERDKVILYSMKHEENFGDIEGTYTFDEPISMKMLQPENEDIHNRTQRTASLSPHTSKNFGVRRRSTRRSFTLRTKTRLETEVEAETLDMDHHYLSFSQFLWCRFVIWPSTYCSALTGLIRLFFRGTLHKMGWIKPKCCDYKSLVFKLCLESTLAMHYGGKRKDDNGNEVAGMFFAEFPIVEQDGSFKIVDLLSIDLDLKSKRMLSAKLDGKDELEADEVAILLFYYTISGNHVKIHGLANWAINLEPKQVKANPFVARNSIVTTIYNYFGFHSFPSLFPKFKAMRMISENWNPQSLLDTFIHGLEHSLFWNPMVNEMAPHSEFVDFQCKLMPFFLKEFDKVKSRYFPGYDGMAFFVGTVIHSLDHSAAEWNMEDPLWLNINHAKYGKMAEISRVVRCGFLEQHPSFMFHQYFKGCGHPFYDTVYEKASTINQKLADNMDTCIVR